MDINFHYCAVKAVAILTGFSRADAELIATYSQFVDDYKTNSKLSLTNVPSYCSDLVVDGKFQTVQTGFGYGSTLLYSTQKNVVVPFHFVPPDSLKVTGEAYRTVPARYGDTSLIYAVLGSFAHQLHLNPTQQNLIQLGTALHVFSDTYAHSCFNGFDANINKGKVTQARSNTGEVRSYTAYSVLPPIGHARLGTAPDEADLQYTFTHPDDQGNPQQVTRTNWTFFGDCAVQIAECFWDILGVYPSNAQRAQVRSCVEAGSKVKGTNMADLQRSWQAADPALATVPFQYNRPALQSMLRFDEASLPAHVSQEQLYTVLGMAPEERADMANGLDGAEDVLSRVNATATPEFYAYNYAAYLVRDAALNGNIPL